MTFRQAERILQLLRATTPIDVQLILISNCTARKTVAPISRLRAGTLPRGSLELLVTEWRRRRALHVPRVNAIDLYAGRSRLLAAEAAAHSGALLHFVSAGMGLVRHDARLPAYSLTVTPDSDDCILRRGGSNGRFSASEWWRAIQSLRPSSSFRTLLRHHTSALVVIGMTGPYLDMIAAELADLPSSMRERVRIVGARRTSHLPVTLRPILMPYDARLDDPRLGMRGTAFDYPQRALAHFARLVRTDTKIDPAASHARRVRLALARFTSPQVTNRKRASMRELLVLVQRLQRQTSSRAQGLRILRHELGYACEQSRFARTWERSQ